MHNYIGELGPTDLGAQGQRNWFAKHVCNKFCDADWIKPQGQLSNKGAAIKGTTYLWPDPTNMK